MEQELKQQGEPESEDEKQENNPLGFDLEFQDPFENLDIGL